MKVLIRDPATKRHRCKDGSWTEDWKEAQGFANRTEAINFCLAEELDAYQVVLKFSSNSEFDVVVLEKEAAQKMKRAR